MAPTPARSARTQARRSLSAARRRGAKDFELCQEAQRQLAASLVDLRGQFHEAVANYSVRIQGLLTQAADVLVEPIDGTTPAEQQARLRTMTALRAEIDCLRLKPSKGRRKDLKAVEKLAEQLGHTIADWS